MYRLCNCVMSTVFSGNLNLWFLWKTWRCLTPHQLLAWAVTRAEVQAGLISLWLYNENNKLWDWKNVFTLHIPPLSSTHLWLHCSNFFNPSKKNSFGCAANRKSQRLIGSPMYYAKCNLASAREAVVLYAGWLIGCHLTSGKPSCLV
jgi:hypothetical protein